MIEKSKFKNNEEIKTIIKEKYGLNIFSVLKVNRGSANIFFLNKDKYILKEFQSSISKAEIDKEIDIINYLKAKKLPVPTYIKLIDKTYSFIHNGNVVIIQKFIKGYTKNANEGNYYETIQSAKYLGIIVNALKDYPKKLDDTNKFSFINDKNAINKIISLKKNLDLNNEIDKKINNDLDDKIAMLNNLKIDFSDFDKLTIMNTHGDYNVLQFIYENGEIKAVIDFIKASKMQIAWEVIRSYSYIDEDAKNGQFNIDTFIDYVKEFTKHVSLNEYDLKYMVYIYLIQILYSTYGYKQFLENRKLTDLLEFGYFRTNTCRYLYKNEKIITKRLLEEI